MLHNPPSCSGGTRPFRNSRAILALLASMTIAGLAPAQTANPSGSGITPASFRSTQPSMAVLAERWSVTTQTPLYATGPVGGPFTSTQATYLLENFYNQPLNWTVINNQPWVTTDRISGMIAPGHAVRVTASILQGNAANLGTGTHSAQLTFAADLASGVFVHDVLVTANGGSAGLQAVIETPPNTMRIAPYSTMFGGTESTDGGVPIVRWEWDFGDSNSQDPRTDEGMLIGHRFDNPGNYTVRLTVFDEAGASDSTTTMVQVVPFSGQTFYVSNSAGNDSNSGTDLDSAWRTLEYAVDHMGGSQNNPNRLLLKRGDVWTQNQNLSTVGPSIIAAYGTGAKPKIQFPGTDNHISLGHHQEWGLSRIVSDLHITNPTGPRISKKLVTSVGHGNTIRNCDIDGGGIIASHTAGVDPEEHIQLLVIEDTNVSNGERFGLYSQYHSWISSRRSSFTGSGSTNILDHQMYLNIVRKTYWEDCYFNGGGGFANFGMKQNSVVHGLFRGCEVTNTRNGISCGTNFSDDTDPSNTNVINEGHTIHDIGGDQQGSAFRLTRIKSVTIRNCVMYNINISPDWAISTIAMDNDDPGARVKILNNTFYSNDVPDIDIGSGLYYDSIEIKNNIFVRDGAPHSDHSFYEISQTAMIPVIDSDYNNFWWPGQDANDLTFAIGGSNLSYSFNDWKQSFNQDAHSIWADPVLPLVNSGNFGLSASSPCVNAGEALPGSHEDINGNQRPSHGAHDIGAYEL